MGLEDKTMVVLDTVNLPLVLGDEKHKWKVYTEFTMVDIPLAYNVILELSILNCHGIVINMDFLWLMFLALGGVAVVWGSQKSA